MTPKGRPGNFSEIMSALGFETPPEREPTELEPVADRLLLSQRAASILPRTPRSASPPPPVVAHTESDRQGNRVNLSASAVSLASSSALEAAWETNLKGRGEEGKD